ncbi:MAG TPA: OsmC family protein [Vicinamibacterales bacterium]|jgi:putative redox protein|nr:OsmC family protein [Vicinamibacterales bacterium]
MADVRKAKPPTTVSLVWQHDLVLGGQSGNIELTLDSAGVAGPSPVQTLAFALAGCMAMDVVHVLTKGRCALRGLRLDLSGQRAPTDPHRFTEIGLHFTITGDVKTSRIDRAIELSREKYCSVWHSMRQDIPLKVTYTVSPGV